MRGRGNVWACAGLLLTALGAGPASATDVSALLTEVSEAARFRTPTRAILAGETGPGLTVYGSRDTIRIDTANGSRTLVRHSKAVTREQGRLRRVDLTSRPAGLPVPLEDLAIFTRARLRLPQISDESPSGIVVTSPPGGPSGYVLLVFTIDPERRVVTKTQSYRSTINNLVGLRRDTLFVRVGEQWRPTAIELDDLEHGITSRWTLTWTEVPELPTSMFTPSGLR